MASWNFRRGLCLFQLKRQMDLAASRNLTTTVKRLGGGYVVHGGEAVKTPTKVDIGNREVIVCFTDLLWGLGRPGSLRAL